MINLGDVSEDATVYLPWNSNDSTGASAAVVGGTIRIYKDGDTDQKLTANGVTDSRAFDGVTGTHIVIIDTSDDTGDAGWWVDGAAYQVMLEDATIDSKTVNAFLGMFTIEVVASSVWDRVLTGVTHNITNSAGKRLRQVEAANVLSEGTAQAGAAGTITLAAGESAVNNWYNHCLCVLVGGAGAGQAHSIASYDGGTKVATMTGNWHTNPAGGTEYIIYAFGEVDVYKLESGAAAQVKSEVDTALTDIKLDHLIAVADADDVVDDSVIGKMASTDGDWSNFAKADDSLQSIRDNTGAAGAGLTAINLPNQTMDIVGSITGNLSGSVGSVTGNVGGDVQGNVDGSVGSVTGAVGSVTGAVGSVTGNVGGNVTGSVGSVVGHTNQTGDNFARLGAPAGASVSADIAAAKAVVDAILLDTGTDGVVLSTAQKESVADVLLNRNIDGGGNGTRTVEEALSFLRNKWTLVGNTLTVYETDDATPLWTGTVTKDAAADPVTASDPA